MSLRLPVLGEHMRQPHTLGLGLDLQLPNSGNFGIAGIPSHSRRSVGPTPIFGFDLTAQTNSTSAAAAPVLGDTASRSSSSSFSLPSSAAIELLELVEDSALLKTRLGTIATVVDAVLNGKELADEIKKAKALGQSESEAVACETIKAITKGILGDAFTGAISAGIPTYLAAARLDPRIQATLPIVLPLIPYAYKGADEAALLMGNFAQAACHASFH